MQKLNTFNFYLVCNISWQANSILLPLEASLANDLADASYHENDSNNSLGSRSLFVQGKTLYQSYNLKVREACRALAPLVSSLTLHATHLHSLLIKLGRTSSLHAGNLHKVQFSFIKSNNVPFFVSAFFFKLTSDKVCNEMLLNY